MSESGVQSPGCLSQGCRVQGVLVRGAESRVSESGVQSPGCLSQGSRAQGSVSDPHSFNPDPDPGSRPCQIYRNNNL